MPFSYRLTRRSVLATGLLLAAVPLVGCDDDDDPIQPPQNQAPIAVASASPDSVPMGDGDQTVVTLDGSQSSDPDGDVLTFSWNVPSGTFVGGTTATSAMAQVTFPGNAPYPVTLTVDDGQGATAQAQLTVEVIAAANEVPVVVVSASQLTTPINDGNQTVITIDASNSTDPDGDPLTYSWVVPSGTFVAGTSATDSIIQVTFPGVAPYVVVVTVSDDKGGSADGTVTITPT